MKWKDYLFLMVILAILLFWLVDPRPACAQDALPVARAVLFYSPTCPKCVQVMNDYLKTLFDQYGNQLQIVGIDGTTPNGHTLYLASVEYFAIPSERHGYPTMIVGEAIMVGTWEIPHQFPGLIEIYLVQDGVDWPDIPGLQKMIAGLEPSPTPGLMLVDAHNISWYERYSLDPLGNTISIVVLIGMVVAFAGAGFAIKRIAPMPITNIRAWFVPVLCTAGLFVAGYLAYVETTQVKAFCGPVGDCNIVQESEYARLFGIIPVGVLGIVGYILILVSWCLGRYGKTLLSSYAIVVMFAMTALGILFSIYLTFLEPFVIGATCAWCLTSAILMTLLFWFSLAPMKDALLKIKDKKPD